MDIRAEKILTNHLSAPLATGAIPQDDYDRVAAEVNGMILGAMPYHAEHAALAARTNLGPPWHLRNKREWLAEIDATNWGI
jgi:hypothetical protein